MRSTTSASSKSYASNVANVQATAGLRSSSNRLAMRRASGVGSHSVLRFAPHALPRPPQNAFR